MMNSRYRDWKIWRKCNGNGKVYKVLVLLGLVHSPTFEVFHARQRY